MRKISLKVLSGAVILNLLASCGNAGSSAQEEQPADTMKLTGGLEKKAPNTNYKPAFEGQTRTSNVVKTTTPYKVDKLAQGLGNPWSVEVLPDGKLLLTEKSGYMRLLSAEGDTLKRITGLPKVDASGQGGLLDVALDPDFATNKIIYWVFSEPYKKGNLTAVAKGKLNEAAGKVDNPIVIFRATPELDNSSYHYGSRIVFDKDGNMFVSAGERSVLNGRRQAQDLNSHLGKIFKITKDGKPAPGNPFLNRSDALPAIFAYGVRNPQGLAISPVTGELWEAEFGPRGGDEVNIIRAGKNYGWPVITYGIEYSGEPIGDAIQQKEGMEQPIYYWDPTLSPSGMSFYTGNAIPEWENNLFICGLSGSRIDRLVIKDDKVVGEEWLLTDMQERFRDIVYSNGMFYVVTDAGNLYRISKG